MTRLLRKAERTHVITLFRQSRLHSTAAGNFFQYFRVMTGKTHRPPIPDLHTNCGIHSTSTEKANVLNTFFGKQSPNAMNKHSPDLSSLPTNSTHFSNLATTPAEVIDAIKALPKRKAAGPDGITNELLKMCAPGISACLAALFNRSFTEGVLPSEWKEAVVVSVFKRGNRDQPTTYRPIALLSAVNKVCERVVYQKLYPFLTTYLSIKQSGFRKNDGAVLQLTRLVQQWSEALDSSRYIGVIFFDLKKAFDRVWHTGLIAKLCAAGVSGPALAWLTNYLSNRTQRTKVEGAMSSKVTLDAGVPQGAILSPLLFNLYVNDLVSCSTADVNLFADDTSFFIEDRSPTSLAVRLQDAVDSLSTWFDKWHLSVNVEKTALLVIRGRLQPLEISIKLNGEAIPQVRSHKHLGVTFSESLTWSNHVNDISEKAARRIGLLRRFKSRLPKLPILCAYTTFIRPPLEYASVAWSGLSAKDSQQLERLQRRAARVITGESYRSDIPPEILLARAGLPSLQSRRKIEQLVFGFKFLQRSLPNHILEALELWTREKPEKTKSLRNRDAIRLPLPKKSVLKRSPLYSSITLWNSLSAETKALITSSKKIRAVFSA